ncbi:MAG: YidC/Oxa1 family membrane protein insertase [Armatimonadota bacterium]
MTDHTTSTPRPRLRRRLIIAGLLLALVALVVAGCFGGSKQPALSASDIQMLAGEMAKIEQSSDAALAKYAPPAGQSADFLTAYSRDVKAARNLPFGEKTAFEYYENIANSQSPYSSQAWYQIAVMQVGIAVSAQGRGQPAEAQTYFKYAKANLTRLNRGGIQVVARNPAPAYAGGAAEVASTPPASAGAPTQGLYPEAKGAGAVADPVFYIGDGIVEAPRQLNFIYENAGDTDATYYRIVDAFVGFFNNSVSRTYGAAIALIFISLIIKLVTMPLTTMSYRGMRDMQRVQPLIKELQEKYKDDKARAAEEQMKLMKEHKVNPLGGCLPMLIQLPVFIVVYNAVKVYAWQFSQSPFLWIKSLALPDLPLLILYAISMIVTQKLTTAPSTDPQQRAMQTQMTYLMPVMLLFILFTLPSAFVLYWFFLNVFSAAHQYYLVKKFDAMEAAAAAGKPAAIPEKPAAAPQSSRKAKRGKR